MTRKILLVTKVKQRKAALSSRLSCGERLVPEVIDELDEVRRLACGEQLAHDHCPTLTNDRD